MQYGEVIRWLSDKLPEDTIIAGGAGNFAGWLHRHFRYKGFRTQLGSTNGSMGYGYPAAVAAKLAEPKRTVFALCGDGDFLMTGQEIATAVQYGANFVAVVVNNGIYGTIRMHQEREYPGRVYGTELRNPGFRRLRARLRRPRRDGGAHRGLRAGLRARRGLGQAGDHRAEDRSRTPSRRRRRSPRSGRRRSSQSNELRVVLLGALELEELVVAAARAVRDSRGTPPGRASYTVQRRVFWSRKVHTDSKMRSFRWRSSRTFSFASYLVKRSSASR